MRVCLPTSPTLLRHLPGLLSPQFPGLGGQSVPLFLLPVYMKTLLSSNPYFLPGQALKMLRQEIKEHRKVLSLSVGPTFQASCTTSFCMPELWL